jgi:2-dehydro-3-deoxyphosphooctonate aldolase (KDO 8-P synthase)
VIESEELTLSIARRLKVIVSDLPVQLIFKASFDKANRTSGSAFRGAGIEAGLTVLANVKKATGLPVTTDIHESHQAEPVAAVCDCPNSGVLARQTDLWWRRRTGAVNVKRQFMAPWDMRNRKLNDAGCRNVLSASAARSSAMAGW